ncbi:ELKS/Rab6-interacting/CAST family member 1-like [Physella acuta]|uniref:ELKS/Rab6-interacting/CAST family member 1-like n=1 Tax=Physella acuta TaxID=109671 RepID=UPI0027DDD3F4|nr:ELKS/Rab6-interacting/CAST family member 1-like [Physella acuta]XP_059151048.1 ELKS/Rab6-interacting/CAST family member 1-like [Physella acuta]
MIKMFSKNRSSRRKEKSRDGAGSSNIDVSHTTGSMNRQQADAMYSISSSSNTSPIRNSSSGHSPSYIGGYGNGSIERPPRGRAMSDGSPAEFAISSPLDFPLEHLQSFNATYGLNPSQRTYIDSRPVPRHTPLKSLISPTHSRSLSSSRNNTQGHTRAGSTSSLGTSMRDRSLDRIERENAYLGDTSLDRHFEQMQYSMQMDNRLNHDTRYNTTGRDRSLDREYPHMGARSLERDPHSISRSRSTDRGGEYNYPSATLPSMPLLSHPSSIQPDHSSSEFRNSLVFEMQVQISDLHKEVGRLQKDLDQTREKLSSSMNSIKTFWSPELKKERAVRKEEAARCNLLNEQLKVTQAELKKHRELLKDREDISHSSASYHGLNAGVETSSQEVINLKQERDIQSREMLILKKTIEELEIRIDSQKQTLEARDESIKKLLEMLHSKGVNITKMDEERKELEALKSQLKEEEQKRKQLERDLNEKDSKLFSLDREISHLKDYKVEVHGLPGDHKLHAILEARDARILSLEKEVQQLEDRLLKSKEDSAGLSSPVSTRDSSLRDLASAKEKLIRVEIQSLKSELVKKDTELAGLRLKIDTLERQHSEREDYVSVLKDQITSKEGQTTMLQADIEGLQERLKLKDGTIERKNKETSATQAEKRRLELEVMELKDQLEIKASRISSLQRKIEGLEDTIREKEDQLSQARVRLTTTFTESPSDSTLSALEDGLAEKDKQIERLKDQREQIEKEHQEEIDIYMKKAQDLKNNLDSLQKELTAKQTEICELREQTTELQAIKFEQEGKIRKLESELQEKRADYQRITLELEEAVDKNVLYEKEKADQDLKRKEESQPANLSKQESKQLQAEIEKLQEMLKEAEADKAEKENEIKDLQEIVKEYKQKMGTLKRNQQTEKKKNAQLLEEARKREDSMTDDASHLSSAIKKSNDRVEELEEALRQSVIITAEREMAMADLQGQLEDAKSAMDEMRSEIESLQQSSHEYDDKVAALFKQLEEKDGKLRKLTSERQKHLQEVYEMKQEAIQAAISEKDSTLALLEMTSTKNQKNMEEIERLTQEKHKLQAQLRDVTTKRMKLAHRGASRERRSESKERNADGKSASASNSPTRYPPSLPEKAKSAGSSPTDQSPDKVKQMEASFKSDPLETLTNVDISQLTIESITKDS